MGTDSIFSRAVLNKNRDSFFAIISVESEVCENWIQTFGDSSVRTFSRMRSRIGSLRDDMIGAVQLSIEVCSIDSFHFHGSR